MRENDPDLGFSSESQSNSNDVLAAPADDLFHPQPLIRYKKSGWQKFISFCYFVLLLILLGYSVWSFYQLRQLMQINGNTNDKLTTMVQTNIQGIEQKIEAVVLHVKQLNEKQLNLVKLQNNSKKSIDEQGQKIKTLLESSTGQDGSEEAVNQTLVTLTAEQDIITSKNNELSDQMLAIRNQMETVDSDIKMLKKMDPASDIERLTQDLLVVKSEVEQSADTSKNTDEFDAFRQQIMRNIKALQKQVLYLQNSAKKH